MDRISRSIKMLLDIKEYALSVVAEKTTDEPLLKITGCGALSAAKLIDNLVDSYNRNFTRALEYQYLYDIYHEDIVEWHKIGFDRSPSEYSEARQAELAALAKRWQEEDDQELDQLEGSDEA